MKDKLSGIRSLANLFKVNLLVFGLLSVCGCGMQKEVQLSGKTMGTTYHVTVVSGYFKHPAKLQAQIDRRLEEINQAMSTYRKVSEISRFNDFLSPGERFCVSKDFWQVMKIAQKIYRLSDGAWDGTVRPLVSLWGFYKVKNSSKIPPEPEIQAQLNRIGFDHIEVTSDGCLIKDIAGVSLDLASIAKGYGVDQIAALIKKNGFDHFLVEIGGEVFAAGLRADGKPWRVGINQPLKEAAFDQVYKVLHLSEKALATSGDYRIFFEFNGKRYGHIIDPRNGYPVSNGVVSVSIIADTCAVADGLATAITVLGHEKGLELLNRLRGVEGLIVVQQLDGSLFDYYSSGFRH